MVEKITIGTFGREVIKFDDKNDSHSFVEIKCKH